MAIKKYKTLNTTKKECKTVSIDQLLDFSRSINKKAKTNLEYKEVIDMASEKWENSCSYDFR